MKKQPHEALQLKISKEVSVLMEQRHILEDNIKEVVYHAEKSGERLRDINAPRFLAKMVTKKPVATFSAGKKIMKAFTCYVIYSRTEDAYEIHSVYGHNAEIQAEGGIKDD
jgi:hypothetical protein